MDWLSFDLGRIKFKPEEDEERTEVLVSLGKSCNSGLRIMREEKEEDLKGAKMIKSKADVGIRVRKNPDVEQQLKGLGQRGACRCQDLH
jgi:hypothetical protein